MKGMKLLTILPLALAIISFIAFLVGISARVTSLEAEEYSTKSDIKNINESISDIQVHVGRLDEKISAVKDNTDFIKNRIK